MARLSTCLSHGIGCIIFPLSTFLLITNSALHAQVAQQMRAVRSANVCICLIVIIWCEHLPLTLVVHHNHKS